MAPGPGSPGSSPSPSLHWHYTIQPTSLGLNFLIGKIKRGELDILRLSLRAKLLCAKGLHPAFLYNSQRSQALVDQLYWWLVCLGKIQETAKERDSQNKGVAAASSPLSSPYGGKCSQQLCTFCFVIERGRELFRHLGHPCQDFPKHPV